MTEQDPLEGVSTESTAPSRDLVIAGRPRAGESETYTILEEHAHCVQMHGRPQGKVPHYRANCPYCATSEKPRPFWYVGGVRTGAQAGPVIIEISDSAHRILAAAAQRYGGLAGLQVIIRRTTAPRSPRQIQILRRLSVVGTWSHHTRGELARIWRVLPAAPAPRIYPEVG